MTEAGASKVSMVIPGRNCAGTIRACLDAATAILRADNTALAEIIFVDDASTDPTAQIVSAYPVRLIRGNGGGPGAARNIGWRAAQHALVWFVDSDCVPEPHALSRLLTHLSDPSVGGVGGSYGNEHPHSLLACLIHEEIITRHRRMPVEVNFLGGFNVLYQREALEAVGGFDECEFNGPGSPGAEDAELAYRIHAAGYRLRFEPESRVGHHHPTKLRRYLRSQRHHGYWRVFLHLRHRSTAGGDTYSGLFDHAQPPLALLMLASLPTLAWPALRWIALLTAALLFAAQWPGTWRLIRPSGRWSYVAFAGLGFIRAIWRGIGMVQGICAYPFRRRPARPEVRS